MTKNNTFSFDTLKIKQNFNVENLSGYLKTLGGGYIQLADNKSFMQEFVSRILDYIEGQDTIKDATVLKFTKEQLDSVMANALGALQEGVNLTDKSTWYLRFSNHIPAFTLMLSGFLAKYTAKGFDIKTSYIVFNKEQKKEFGITRSMASGSLQPIFQYNDYEEPNWSKIVLEIGNIVTTAPKGRSNNKEFISIDNVMKALEQSVELISITLGINLEISRNGSIIYKGSDVLPMTNLVSRYINACKEGKRTDIMKKFPDQWIKKGILKNALSNKNVNLAGSPSIEDEEDLSTEDVAVTEGITSTKTSNTTDLPPANEKRTSTIPVEWFDINNKDEAPQSFKIKIDTLIFQISSGSGGDVDVILKELETIGKEMKEENDVEKVYEDFVNNRYVNIVAACHLKKDFNMLKRFKALMQAKGLLKDEQAS